MYCPLCAVEFEAGRARCPSCGAPVQTGSAPEVTVPRTRQPVEWTPAPRMASPGPHSVIGPAAPPDPSGQPAGAPSWLAGDDRFGQFGQADRTAPAGRAAGSADQATPPRGAWWAATRCVGTTVAVVYAVGLGLALIYAAIAGDLPGSSLATVPAAGVATAFGAEWGLTLGGRDVNSLLGIGGNLSYDVRAYPLLLSALGLIVLAWLVRRDFATGVSADTLTDRLSHAARVGLLLGTACLALALLSRQSIGSGQINASYGLALIAGMVVGGLIVAVMAVWHDPAQAPPTLRRLGTELVEPLVALRLVVPAIVLLGIVQLLGVLVFGRVDDDLTAMGLDTTTSRSLGIALLVPYAPNAAWMLFGVVIGAPLHMRTGIGLGGDSSTSLVDLATGAGWWWLAPLAAFVVLFAAGTLLALRSPNVATARHRVGVWSLTFGVASLALSYLGAVTLHLSGSFGNVQASVGNNPAWVLALSCAWALLSGLGAVALVARLAPATRNRWAAAVRPAPGTPDPPYGQPHGGPGTAGPHPTG